MCSSDLADEAGDDEGEHHPRPGLLCRFCGEDEDTGADDAANAEQLQKDAVAEARRKRREQELNEIILGVGVAIVAGIFLAWAAYEAITFCSAAVCGR